MYNALPALFAWLLDTEGTANYSYNGVWMVLSVPVTIILWIAIGRIRIYNHPVLEQILPDGRTKPVRADGDPPVSLWGLIKLTKERAGWGGFLFLVGFSLFMFLGTLAAILSPD